MSLAGAFPPDLFFSPVAKRGSSSPPLPLDPHGILRGSIRPGRRRKGEEGGEKEEDIAGERMKEEEEEGGPFLMRGIPSSLFPDATSCLTFFVANRGFLCAAPF